MRVKVGFIGVGKLGQPCAEAMAEKHDVLGYDVAKVEPSNFKMRSTMAEAVKDREIIFIAVQTPHDPRYGGTQPISNLKPVDFNYSRVEAILEELNDYLTKDQLVVLISTVLPGTTRALFIPLVRNYRFIYNPYLIAMGSVAWDMVNPEMVIIGTEDGSETGDAKLLTDFYRTLMQNDPRYVVGTWDEAECIKIFYNTFISAKLSLVNMIQDVAEKNGNIDVDVVTDALKGATMRITGPKYMTAGMGDAGPCHPRDNIALRYLGDRLALHYDLFEAIMVAREVQAENLAKTLVRYAKERDLPIYINGESYKPGVPFTDGSYSILVAHYVERLGHDVYYLDPITRAEALPEEVLGVVLLAHSSEVTYGEGEKVQTYADILPGSVVVDPWRCYPEVDGVTVIHYGNTRSRT